jgi:hypothetical protein
MGGLGDYWGEPGWAAHLEDGDVHWFGERKRGVDMALHVFGGTLHSWPDSAAARLVAPEHLRRRQLAAAYFANLFARCVAAAAV